MKKVALFIILVILLGSVLLEALGFTWSRETQYTSCQPPEINYSSFDPYCLYLIKRNRTLGSQNIIFISKKLDPEYGTVLYFPEAGVIGPKERKEINVSWTNDGIFVETNSNLRLFIPAKNFIGGR